MYRFSTQFIGNAGVKSVFQGKSDMVGDVTVYAELLGSNQPV